MIYKTRDSGKRKQFSTGMVRDTSEDKPRFDLLLPRKVPYADQMLTRWANLLQRGAKKYDERNWEKASTQEELDRFMESASRHLIQWMCGETDEDHAAAVLYNVAGAEYVKVRMSQEASLSEASESERESDTPSPSGHHQRV